MSETPVDRGETALDTPVANTKLLEAIAQRGYEHPRDIFCSDDPREVFGRVRSFGLLPHQKELVQSHVDEGYAQPAVEAMELVAISSIQRRINEERLSLEALGVMCQDENTTDMGIDWPALSQKLRQTPYGEMGGSPEKMADFVVWFDLVARDALAKQVLFLRQVREKQIKQSLALSNQVRQSNTKGFGLELGSAIMAGDWTYGQELWKAVDNLSPTIAQVDGYEPTFPSEEVHRPSYTLNLSFDKDFAIVKRERGVWDIITPEGARMYVAHRMMGLVAVHKLPREQRAQLKNAIASRRSIEPYAQSVGELFEERIAAATNEGDYNGILPESSTVYVRHPMPKEF